MNYFEDYEEIKNVLNELVGSDTFINNNNRIVVNSIKYDNILTYGKLSKLDWIVNYRTVSLFYDFCINRSVDSFLHIFGDLYQYSFINKHRQVLNKHNLLF